MSFTNLQELIGMAEQENTTIAELMIKTEEVQKGLSRETIIEKMSEQFTVMEEAVRRGTQSPVMSRTGLTGEMETVFMSMPKTGTPLSILHNLYRPQPMHLQYQKLMRQWGELQRHQRPVRRGFCQLYSFML